MFNAFRNYLQNFEKKFWQKRRNDLKPSIFQFDYLHYQVLSKDIVKGFATIRKRIRKEKIAIVDIGCGKKPYLSVFAPYAKTYTGVDVDPEIADVVSYGEKLPFANNSFDLAVSFQTLEHCQNPLKVIAEMKRVLKPKGYALLTTHGIWMHHPCPHDYYRWTHEGLHELFKSFSEVSAEATLKSWSSLLQLVNVELYSLACRHWFLKLPLYGMIVVFNFFGRIFIPFGKKHLTINYLVIARK